MRPKSDLAKDVEEVKKVTKEIKKMLDVLKKKMLQDETCIYIEENYEMNMRYVNKTKGLQMIVDIRAPMVKASSVQIDKYLKSREESKDEIIDKSFNRRFRMGENVLKSDKEITMPVVIEVRNGDKKIITVSIIEREEDLFLCSLQARC